MSKTIKTVLCLGAVALMLAMVGCDNTSGVPDAGLASDTGVMPSDAASPCDGVVCDNGVFCDGAEVCDEMTGACTPGADPCGAGETCDEAAGLCGAAALPECEIDDGGGTSACDYACIGGVTAPAGASEVTVSVQLLDMIAEAPEPHTTVHVYVDNDPGESDTCSDGCLELVSDAEGRISFSAPEGAWFAYRLLAREAGTDVNALIDTVERNLVVTASEEVHLTSVQPNLLGLLPLLWGVTRTPGTATIIGGAEDCGGSRVANLQVRVFDADNARVGAPRYFDDTGTPSGSVSMTSLEGLYGAINVPVPADGNPVRVELWGTEPGSLIQTRLGCEEAHVLADGMTLLDIRPLREDGPEGCR